MLPRGAGQHGLVRSSVAPGMATVYPAPIRPGGRVFASIMKLATENGADHDVDFMIGAKEEVGREEVAAEGSEDTG